MEEHKQRFLSRICLIWLSQTFDAVVGRAVLLYIKERVSLLQTINKLLRPGGIVVFQEPDIMLTELAMSHGSASPLFRQCLTWMRKLFDQTGNDSQISLCFPQLFEDAGFPLPQMQVIARVASASDLPVYEWMTDLIHSQHELLIQFGIATVEEIAIETLAHRLQEEARMMGSPVISKFLVGAWARKAER